MSSRRGFSRRRNNAPGELFGTALVDLLTCGLGFFAALMFVVSAEVGGAEDEANYVMLQWPQMHVAQESEAEWQPSVEFEPLPGEFDFREASWGQVMLPAIWQRPYGVTDSDGGIVYPESDDACELRALVEGDLLLCRSLEKQFAVACSGRCSLPADFIVLEGADGENPTIDEIARTIDRLQALLKNSIESGLIDASTLSVKEWMVDSTIAAVPRCLVRHTSARAVPGTLFIGGSTPCYLPRIPLRFSLLRNRRGIEVIPVR